jgi:hypothetical protein
MINMQALILCLIIVATSCAVSWKDPSPMMDITRRVLPERKGRKGEAKEGREESEERNCEVLKGSGARVRNGPKGENKIEGKGNRRSLYIEATARTNVSTYQLPSPLQV